MDTGREADGKMLMEMPKEKLVELLFMHMRNLWAVDGLYFLGIEDKFSTEAAAEIDRDVWEVMGKLEARRLKSALDVKGDDVPTMMNALRHTGWSLDLEDKKVAVEKNRAVFRNTNCRVQQTRIKQGLSEFPCKQVRWGYLKSFAKEFNPDIEVKCNVCPPDKHREDLWCEWEFVLQNE